MGMQMEGKRAAFSAGDDGSPAFGQVF